MKLNNIDFENITVQEAENLGFCLYRKETNFYMIPKIYRPDADLSGLSFRTTQGGIYYAGDTTKNLDAGGGMLYIGIVPKPNPTDKPSDHNKLLLLDLIRVFDEYTTFIISDNKELKYTGPGVYIFKHNFKNLLRKEVLDVEIIELDKLKVTIEGDD